MSRITGFLKAVFNFFVGDWIILGGVVLTLVLVALIENTSALSSLKGTGGVVLFVGIVLTLVATLRREIRA
jgi:hypothetical protein